MNKSVVNAEVEIAGAYNKLLSYEDYLIRMIDRFRGIIDAIQEGPIKDQLISSQLSKLSEELNPLVTALDKLVQSDGKAVIQQDLNEVAAADNFKFPHMELARLSHLLAGFLGG